MLLEIPKKSFLFFYQFATLNSSTQNLDLNSQELPYFVGRDTHSTSIHSRAFEGGHRLIYLLATKEQLLGLKLEEELLKDIFNKREEIFSPSK